MDLNPKRIIEKNRKQGKKGYQVSKVIYTVGENTLSLYLQLHTFRFLIGLNAVMQNVNWKAHISLGRVCMHVLVHVCRWLGAGAQACVLLLARTRKFLTKAKTCISIFI